MIVIELRLEDQDAIGLCTDIRPGDAFRQSDPIACGRDGCRSIGQGDEPRFQRLCSAPVDRYELLVRCRTHVRRWRNQENLHDNYQCSFEISLTDGLTGLYDRRYQEAYLGGLIDRNFGGRRHLSVIMFDIDHFKKIDEP